MANYVLLSTVDKDYQSEYNSNSNRHDAYGAVITAKPLWQFTQFI